MKAATAFRNRWSRNWRQRLAAGVAATVGVVAGAGVIAATAQPSGTTPKASTPPATNANDDSQATATNTAPTESNSQFPWGDDDGGFQPAPFNSSSLNFNSPPAQPQASTRAS